MNSSNAIVYDNTLVQKVFNTLSIDKTRLPSSGLTAIGIPSFVAEWLLDKIVPGIGALTSAELEKVNNFVKKAFPRKDDRNEIFFNLTQGEVHKLIALMQVRVKLDQTTGVIPDPFARIPVINLNDCSIPTDLIERNKMLLRQGVWGKISISMRSDGRVEVMDFDPFQCSKVDLQAYANCRSKFTSDAWRDLLFCSMGFNPQYHNYNPSAKTWILARLLPLVESNYP